jgi:hypothetical protein
LLATLTEPVKAELGVACGATRTWTESVLLLPDGSFDGSTTQVAVPSPVSVQPAGRVPKLVELGGASVTVVGADASPGPLLVSTTLNVPAVPGVTEIGFAVTDMSLYAVTEVFTAETAAPEFVVPFGEVSDAAFVIVCPADVVGTVPVIVIVTAPPGGRLTPVDTLLDDPEDVAQVAPPAPEHDHDDTVTEDGTGSASVAPVTSVGPLFVAVTV